MATAPTRKPTYATMRAPCSVRACLRASAPPDPDATGGYYQPVRVALDDDAAVGLERILCPLTDAPIALAQAFRARYVPNRNPVLLDLKASLSAGAVALDRIPRGAELTLEVGWPEDSAERFVVYDKAVAALVEQREAMRASWFVTAGELGYDRTGRAAGDTALTTTNFWRAPTRAGTVQLFIVLRDSRGGATHQSYELHVR